MESYLSALKFGDVALMLKHLDDFRILCAKNTGIYGVQRLNELVSKALFQVEEHRDVDGKIIMITKNEHHLKLYNGDVGLIYKGQAWFPSAEGPRAMSIAGLPERTSAYAMTIHKSQGSEFQNVMLILDDRDGSHLNKDLIYTGITRAKATLTMIHDCDVTSQAICRQEQRVSGLASRMRAEASISP
jgi:exodeoxyribonuclease V alpha subunit